MQRAQRTANRRKVHRNFKLDPQLDGLLKREAAKQNRTQTALVEMGLRALFNLSNGGAR